ncbi:TadE/TadG family type IV pilus assembly protein [Paenibacillus silviterrae]|uniref:TadE/TadG family type IV pilus assembly protein n=1 Tax=Paenibacillus silviterrae TaxID=3242194 RepID=UPI0025435532|nr:TadE/TadG family type IV pilus assembly protein [Paenibacillus chinjuensis]
MAGDVKKTKGHHWLHGLLRNQQAQSLTELALLLPVLLLLACGTLDFGRLLYAYLHMNLAAQETVRQGGLGKTDAEIIAFARNYVRLGGSGNLQVQISPTQTNRKSGQFVTVTLRYPLPFMTPVISKFLPSPVVSAHSTIRVE